MIFILYYYHMKVENKNYNNRVSGIKWVRFEEKRLIITLKSICVDNIAQNPLNKLAVAIL